MPSSAAMPLRVWSSAGSRLDRVGKLAPAERYAGAARRGKCSATRARRRPTAALRGLSAVGFPYNIHCEYLTRSCELDKEGGRSWQMVASDGAS
jgi:hypothetical protein